VVESTLFDRIEALRRPRVTGKQIAGDVGVSPATLSQLLRRLGPGKLKASEPGEPFGRALTSALTANADIKINERVSLRTIWIGLA